MSASLSLLSTFLEQGRTSRPLIKEARLHQELHARLLLQIPESMRRFCLGSALREGILTIEWSTPAALSTARFLGPGLASFAGSDHGVIVRDVKMRVRPSSKISPPMRRTAITPGPKAIEHLLSTSENRPDDAVGHALERLGQTLKKKRGEINPRA